MHARPLGPIGAIAGARARLRARLEALALHHEPALLRELLRYIGPHRKYDALTLVFGVLGLVLSYAYPWIIGSAVDVITAPPSSRLSMAARRAAVLRLTGLAGLTAILHAVVVYGRGHFNVQLGHGVVTDIRRTLFEHLQSLSLRFFMKERTGSILGRVLHDVHEATALIYTGIIVAGMDAVQLLVALVLLAKISWELTAACLVLFPLYGVVFAVMNPRVRKASERMHAQLSRISGNVTEQLSGQALVKTYTAETRESRRFADDVRLQHHLVVAQSHEGHLVASSGEILVHEEQDVAPDPRTGCDGPWVLDDLTLEARAGERVALVGPSGAGKTTLVSLLPRLYDVTEGRVLVDGVDVRDYYLRALRSAIAIVQQDSFMFTGTLRDNIAYGRPTASDEEILLAAIAAHAHEFIERLPDGYETRLGERGVNLSGGQRQRVSIARALLKDPRILILDEATSSLDTESETIVQRALDEVMRGRTCFIVAHRLSTIRNADRIVVLDGGRIAEIGTHEELAARGGVYARLVRHQAA